jgi:hypothetical protein
MDKGLFQDREKAMEAKYFRDQDARLVDKLRQNAKLDDIATALAEKLQVDNPELLLRVRELGITADTAPAFFLAPLVQVAWAEGSITKAEQDAVLRLARERGVEESSPAYAQLVEWLKVRPSDSLLETAVEVIKSGYSVLPAREREERIKRVVDACHEVAAASGGGLAQLLGLRNSVSNTEASMLDHIMRTLRSHG